MIVYNETVHLNTFIFNIKHLFYQESIRLDIPKSSLQNELKDKHVHKLYIEHL